MCSSLLKISKKQTISFMSAYLLHHPVCLLTKLTPDAVGWLVHTADRDPENMHVLPFCCSPAKKKFKMCGSAGLRTIPCCLNSVGEKTEILSGTSGSQ